jgi:uncharacterized protein (TIRG00374 family)
MKIEKRQNNSKIKFAQYIFTFFLVLFIVVLILKFSDLKEFLVILSNGIWYYIVLFIFLQLLYLIVQSEIYLGLFSIFDKTGSLSKTLQVFLATNFVNLALPFSGVSGVVTFIGYAKKIGLHKIQALIINLLFYILVFLSFSLMNLFFLFFINDSFVVNPTEKNTIIIFSVVVILLTVVFIITISNEKISNSVTNFITKMINFFSRIITKTELIDKSKLDFINNEFTTLKHVFKQRRKIFFVPFLYSLLGHFLHFLILYVIFLAFGSAVNPMVALVGYIISVVFIVVSFTPSGIGIVEPLMILYFVSSGVSVELSTIVTLVFRGVVFWLPFFLGFISIRQMHKVDSNN